MIKDAYLSPDRVFRYYLIRHWNPYRAPVVFVMLNPSKADETEDDRTLQKCVGFSYSLNYGGVILLNLYAYRATDPADLMRAGFPVGPLNDEMLRTFTAGQDVICGWGANARGHARADDVLRLIREGGGRPRALRLLADGVPEHPLYLPATCKPVPL